MRADRLVYRAVEQSALGVMTLEPDPNWVGLDRQQQEVDAIAYRFKTLQVIVTGATPSVTIQLQGSLDGVNWVSLGELTTSGSVVVSDFWTLVRVNITAWTAGTVNASLLLAC